MSESKTNARTLYRHKGDASILYEVRVAGEGRYEVRRADHTDIFGSEPFLMDANDWEVMYEPVEEEDK